MPVPPTRLIVSKSVRSRRSEPPWRPGSMDACMEVPSSCAGRIAGSWEDSISAQEKGGCRSRPLPDPKARSVLVRLVGAPELGQPHLPVLLDVVEVNGVAGLELLDGQPVLELRALVPLQGPLVALLSLHGHHPLRCVDPSDLALVRTAVGEERDRTNEPEKCSQARSLLLHRHLRPLAYKIQAMRRRTRASAAGSRSPAAASRGYSGDPA